jgi:ABC-type cobalamin/Fe3+-siderophores transport system ATPase subunit
VNENAGAAVLRTRGLTKRYGELVAVDHVDLTVPAGDVYGLLGPNGAGKTTFMRMLFGLIRPDAGSVELFGRLGAGEGRGVARRCRVRGNAALLRQPVGRANLEQEDRDAAVSQPAHQRAHIADARRIEPTRGLVENEQPWRAHQRPARPAGP